MSVSSKGANGLLAERERLIIKNAQTESHLWAGEFLLHRVAKLIPRLFAELPADSGARDTLLEEIHEFLSEPRAHPAAGVVNDDGWPPTDSPGVESVVGGEAGDPTPGGTPKAC